MGKLIPGLAPLAAAATPAAACSLRRVLLLRQGEKRRTRMSASVSLSCLYPQAGIAHRCFLLAAYEPLQGSQAGTPGPALQEVRSHWKPSSMHAPFVGQAALVAFFLAWNSLYDQNTAAPASCATPEGGHMF